MTPNHRKNGSTPMFRKSALAALVLLTTTGAFAADGPWSSDRWRADVSETRQGHVLRTTIVGVETHTARGTRVTATCSTDGKRTIRGTSHALLRQDDFEGEIPGAGTFGIHVPGRRLTWFDSTVCAGGNITWHRL